MPTADGGCIAAGVMSKTPTVLSFLTYLEIIPNLVYQDNYETSVADKS